MGLETGEFIADLVQTNPVTATDPVTEGADHLRLIKKVLQQSLGDMPGLLQFADNNTFLSQSNVAANGFVNMIKVNLDNDVEIGDGIIISGSDIIISGDLTVSAGDLTVSAGDLIVAAGNLTILAAGAAIAQIRVGQTGTGTAQIQLDGSNGDFAGADYVEIKQYNDLNLGIATTGNGGEVRIAAATNDPNVTPDLSISTSHDVTVHRGDLTITAGDVFAQGGSFASPSYSFANAPTTGVFLDSEASLAQSVVIGFTLAASQSLSIGKWSGSDTDIVGLITGSGSGALILAPTSFHMTIALRENDGGDGFQVISGGGDWDIDNTWDTLCFEVKADGNVTVGGDLTVTSNIIADDISSLGDITAFAV